MRFAARPRWLEDADPRGLVCMESNEKFTMTKRKNYCRRCGGVFLKGHATTAELDGLNYSGEVTCCRPCAEGKKRASRFINKVPKSQRSNREAKVRGRAAVFCNSVLLFCTSLQPRAMVAADRACCPSAEQVMDKAADMVVGGVGRGFNKFKKGFSGMVQPIPRYPTRMHSIIVQFPSTRVLINRPIQLKPTRRLV